MKVRVTVGDVSVLVTGQSMTVRQIRALLIDCAGVAATLATETDEPERAPMGFSVITELAKPEEPDLSEFFEDRS